MYLNVIFPPLKYSWLKYLWYIMSLFEINNKSVRKMITENIDKQKLGQKTYLLKYLEAHIVETS